MKKLMFMDSEYKAERIVKTENSITGYNGDIVAFKFSGVSDFSGFTLEEEQEYDVPDSTEIDKLRMEQAQANAELVQLIMMMGGA